MSKGPKFNRLACIMVLCGGAFFSGSVSPALAASTQTHHKAKKAPAPLPPLPSGPTGPVQQVPLDSMSPVPPQVTYQNGQLTIVAPNSTLGDILRAVRKQTGAEIDIPSAPERVVTHLGPGPARDVIADLLNGSRFNYVLLGSSSNEALLTRVVLVQKTGPDSVSPPNGPSLAEQQQLGIVPPTGNPGAVPPEQENNDAEATDDSAATDDNADQAAAEAEQQQPPSPDQPGVKTPQQMLQEMQQRQLMLQQQQPPGQPPVPGSGMPPRPPEQQ